MGMMEKAVTQQAQGGELRIDGRAANMLVVVGAVEELNKQQASMEFALNDSTGRMKCRFFFPSDLKLDAVENGTYVSAVGLLKTTPSLHFSLVALHPVQSPDQISYHMIEVVHASLRSKGKLANNTKEAGFSPQKDASATMVPRPLVSTSGSAPVTKEIIAPNPATMPPAAVESGPLKDRIANFLSANSARPEGVSRTELNTHFSNDGSQAVKAAIDYLL